jgi:integrase
MRIFTPKNIIWLDFTIDGKRYRRSTKLSDTPANRKLVVNEIAPQIQASIVRGEYNPKKKKIMPTVEEFGYRSLELHRHERKPQVNKSYKQNFEKHILPYFGKHLLKQITPIDLQEWQNTIVDVTSSSSLRKYRNIFRQIFVDSMLEGHIEANPFDKIKRPAIEDVKIVPFTKDEIELIITTASIKLRNFFIISVFTGMRTGELTGLNWSDIDYDEKEIHISKSLNRGLVQTVKTKSSNRTIDMLPIVEEYLKEQYKLTGHQEYIFLNSKGVPYYSSDILNLSLKKVLDVCKIPRRTLYNTRHTFASLMLTNSESIMWVSQMLGHKTANITFERYARFIKEDKVNRAKFINKWHIFGTSDNPTRLKVPIQGVE